MTVTEASPSTESAELKEGKVVAIAGPVVDVEFPRGHLPEINHAVQLPSASRARTPSSRRRSRSRSAMGASGPSA